MQGFRIGVLLLLWLGVAIVAVAQDGSLYEGEAPVADQSPEQRAAVLPRALAQVLAKVTGDAGAATDPAFSSALGRAQSMMQQYRYRQDVVTTSGAPELRLFLIARFNAAAVDALIAGSGRSVWPTPRPRPLLWLAIDDGRGPRLVGQDQASAVAPLTARAAERGLRIAFPKGDLQDQTLGGAQSVWRDDLAAVRSAAGRYPSAPLLVGKMQRDSGGWVVDWRLLEGGGTLRQWQSRDAEAAAVLAAGADGAVAALAQHYASTVMSGPPGDYDVVVSGLESATDFARVMSYLQGLSIVQSVQVSQASGDTLILRMSLRAGVESLARLVDNGRLLRTETGPTDVDAAFRLEQ